MIEEIRRKSIKTEFFPVIRTCKGDMKAEFEASPKIQLEIEQFTDAQMKDIAAKIGDIMLDGYWEAMRQAVEEVVSE